MSKHETGFDETARRHIANGVSAAVDNAKVGLGPWGRRPRIAKGGGLEESALPVAPETQLANHFESVGARMVEEVRARTFDAVGDGSTTAMVLAQWIYVAGSELIDAGAVPVELVRGIDTAVEVVVRELKRHSSPVHTKDQMVHVGAVSAGGDESIGSLIVDAVERVGKAVVVLGVLGSNETTLEFAPGMRFESGYLSPYFVTNTGRSEVVLEDCYVLICEAPIPDIRELSPLLDQVAKAGKPLLVIAELDAEALATLAAYRIKGTLDVCAVNPPGSGSQRQRMVREIAIECGCRATPERVGLDLPDLTLVDLGRAKSVIVTRDTTTLIAGAGSGRDRESVAVISVGAPTDAELSENRRRVEGALRATLAASEEGIVPGGGLAFLRALPALAALDIPEEERSGVAIVAGALKRPLRQIAENAGLEGAAVVNEVCRREDGFGYNAIKGEYEDLFASGIVDPTKVVREALQVAAVLAGGLLTTEALLPEPAGHTVPDEATGHRSAEHP